jgi:glutaredoxin
MKFTIYSKEGCSYCEKAKKLLELAKVDYIVYKLGIDFTKDQFISEFGYGSSFPRILADGKLLGGCLDTFKYLEEKNLV